VVPYVADQTAGTITPYAFDFTTGALGAAGTATTALVNGLTNISVDLTGNYLYAGVKGRRGSSWFSRRRRGLQNWCHGRPNPLVAGSPFTAGTGNAGVAATNVVQ